MVPQQPWLTLLVFVAMMNSRVLGEFFKLSANKLDGTPVSFEQYTGKVSLVVNVASQWGYTDRDYKELNQLHKRFSSTQFSILAFPCNSFGGQEPGDAADITTFTTGYKVEFDMFEKCVVRGGKAHPVFKFLSKATDKKPTWNFCKYLVAPNGKDVAFFDSKVSPLSLAPKIEAMLKAHTEL